MAGEKLAQANCARRSMELMATVELVVLQISTVGLSCELVAQDGVERATRVWAKIVAPMGAERPLRTEAIKQRYGSARETKRNRRRSCFFYIREKKS